MKQKIIPALCAAVMTALCSKPQNLTAADIRISGEEPDYTVYTDDAGLEYHLMPDNTAEVAKYTGTGAETLRIPSSVEGYTVSAIGNKAFYQHKELTQVTLPDTLVRIGDSAFSQTALTSVELPDSVTEIGTSAFGLSKSLQSVTLSQNLTAIPATAFNSTPLTSLVIPDSVVSIGAHAFDGCRHLAEIQWSTNLKSIDKSAFYFCDCLTELNLPDSLETIGNLAFAYCSEAEQVHIPASLCELGEEPFKFTPFFSTRISESNTVVEEGFLIYNKETGGWNQTLPEGTGQIPGGVVLLKQAVVLTLPDSVRVLHKNSLICQHLSELRLNEGLKAIESRAVQGSSLLTEVYIPSSVTEISDDAFYPCHLKRVSGITGSAAEQFAKRIGAEFTDASAVQPIGEKTEIVYGKDTWSIHNAGADFGGKYILSGAARQTLSDIMATSQTLPDGAWTGGCYGLSLSLLLVKAGILTPSDLQSGAETLSDVTNTKSVQSFINYCHFTQYSQEVLNAASADQSANQAVYQAIRTAKACNRGALPFLMTLTLPDTEHAVIGYGQEDGTWEFDGVSYDGRILIWDPNFPTAPKEEAYLYYNSATLAYCIPYYKVTYKSGGKGAICLVCNDLSTLYAHPYPFTAASGDVDLNGTVETADAAALLKFLMTESELTPAQADEADLNGDMKLSAVDLSLLLRKLAA